MILRNNDALEGFNNEIRLINVIKISLKSGSDVFWYIFKGMAIDNGTWDYIVEEKRFYNCLDDNKLRKIIDNRNAMTYGINENIV